VVLLYGQTVRDLGYLRKLFLKKYPYTGYEARTQKT